MEGEAKPGSTFRAIVIAFVLLCIVAALGLVGVVSTMSTVSGTASLPSGIAARIHGPFTCSEKRAQTEIRAGGRLFAFSPTTISIDGVPVHALDATVKDVQIDAGYWSATLRINGFEISTAR